MGNEGGQWTNDCVLDKQYLSCIWRESRGLTRWERDFRVKETRKAKHQTWKSIVCSALYIYGLFNIIFVLVEYFQQPNLPKTVDLLLFTQHYHLFFSLYFNLYLFFLEGGRKIMNINGLDLKHGMINYNL